MPIMSKTYRKAFKWRETNRAPVAEVTVLNGRGWLFCCPLCGCMHETRMAQTTGTYEPDCLLRRLANTSQPVGRPAEYGANWQRVLQMWQDIHPAAAAHNTVLLMSAQDIEALDQAQQAAKRKAAARAKRGRPQKDKAA